MKIYLIRHGTPVSKEENPDKPLSNEGKSDVERVAGFLQKSGVTVEKVFHSGKARARQTAEIMASRLNPGVEPLQKRGLSPLDDVEDIADQINEDEQDLLIAGHLPHLGRLTSLLIAGKESIPVVRFQPGDLVCLERIGGVNWSIAWMVTPAIIS